MGEFYFQVWLLGVVKPYMKKFSFQSAEIDTRTTQIMQSWCIWMSIYNIV